MSDSLAIAAAPGCWLVSVEELAVPMTPIVGWMIGATGVSFPCMPAGGPKGYVAGQGFMFPDGYVFDPVLGRTFLTVAEWEAWVSEQEPYVVGKVPSVAGHDGKMPESMKTPAGGRTPTQAKPPVDPGVIDWGTKSFKSNSFWFFSPPGAEPIIFMVNGGDPVPKNAEKITREDFYAKRKAGMSEKAGKPSTDDEPELPLEEDADDLV